MLEYSYNYFKISQKEHNYSITFVEYIKDIIYDETNNIIPFTNGKCYLLYQDISFKILKALQIEGISAEIHIEEKLNTSPIIHISTLKQESNVIDIIIPIINNLINKKFSLI